MTGGHNEYFLPQNKFDTVIFSEPVTPPLEVLLAAKDFGKIYFTAPPSNVENLLKTYVRQFDIEKNFALIELEMVPPLKRELRRRTPQAQLDAKKYAIIQVIAKFPDVIEKFNVLPQHKQNAFLDEYIAELTHAEKILNEIYPELHSDTLKLNFNMFKEFLIDIRLYDEPQIKQLAIDDLNRQLQILAQDLNSL